MIPYQGGKNRLAQRIISLFPSNYEDLAYVEPFGGAGWVLFKKKPSRVEVYNDINGLLVNLFQQIRDNYKCFKRKAFLVLNARKEFEDAKRVLLSNPKNLDNCTKAVFTAVVLIQQFGGRGRIQGTAWGYIKKPSRKSIHWFAFLKRLSQIRKRLLTK